MTPRSLLRPRRLCLALVVGLSMSHRASAQSSAESAHADRVERSMLPSVRVRGRTYTPATIDTRLAETHVPALSIAVIHDGRLAWARAFGVADAATGRRATPTTLFQAASMSKPLTAVAVLQLVAAHRLSLDQNVNDALRSWHLPENDVAHNKPVTVRELLSHTAGVGVSGFLGYAIGDSLPTVPQILDGLPPAHNPPVRVVAEPGTAWSYSGGGYTILQQLVADVSGKPFATVLTEGVLASAKMSSSTFDQPLPVSRRNASAFGYLANGTPIGGGSHVFPQLAAAGLWTTPTDLAQFIMSLQRALRDDGGMLPRPLANAMITPGLGNWGLGLLINGADDTAVFAHTGANEGFRGTFFGFVHTGDGVVVMTNSDAGGFLADEVVRAVAAEYGWPGFAPREIIPVAIDSTILRSWVGQYARGPVRLIITREGDHMYARVPGGQFPTTDALEFVAVAPDHFSSVDGRLAGRIVTAPDGQVTGVDIAGMVLPRQP
jgi:CubicO group peptidase (beta-lactamase class C family)